MKLFLLLTALLCSSGATIAREPFHPQSFTFLLQADAKFKPREKGVQALAESGRDLVVIDYSYTSGRFEKWTRQEIEKIRGGKKGRKVVSYISIGEAENYRAYWRPVWDRDNDGRPDKGAPSFLLPINPGWAGNYRVKYWDPAWQKIVLLMIDEIILQGFDGVYLDIVDAFEGFEYNPANNKWVKGRINPETGLSYREEMVSWVGKIAEHVRARKGDFLVIPQNGAQLLEHDGFVSRISAIGIEDLFTEGNKKRDLESVALILKFLEEARKEGKPILLIEYPTVKSLRDYSIAAAKEQGLILLLTDRSLKTLGDSP